MADNTWTKTTNGDWDEVAYWSAGRIPSGGDDVAANQVGHTLTHSAGSDAIDSIDATQPFALTGGSLTLNASSTFGTLAQSDSTLAAFSGNITIDGDATLGPGSIQKANSSSTATFDYKGTVTLHDLSLGGVNFENDGTVEYSGGGAGGLGIGTTSAYLGGSSIAYVYNFGQFDLQDDSGIAAGPPTSDFYGNVITGGFRNNGLFKKSGGTGQSDIASYFWNAGNGIDVESGVLDFSSGFSSSGDVLIASNTSVLLSGPTASLSGGSWTGFGTLSIGPATTLTAGNATLDTAVDDSGTIIAQYRTGSSDGLTLRGNVSGSGTLAAGYNSTLDVFGAISSDTKVTLASAYQDNSSSTLIIESPSTFAGTITGRIDPTDAILFPNLVANGVSVNAENQLLLEENGSTVATLQLDAKAASTPFLVTSDGANGSRLFVTSVQDPFIVSENSAGQAQFWTIYKGAVASTALVGSAQGTNWKIAATGDFDGNGTPDIAWENTSTGQAMIWLMRGTAIQSASLVGPANGADWQIETAGDLDGDGKADLVWQNVDTGQVTGWLMNGTTISSAKVIGTAASVDTALRASGDLNGDGKADLVFGDSRGQVSAWLMNGLATNTVETIGTRNGADWFVQAVGDLNADKRADIVLENGQGQVAFFNGNGGAGADLQTIGNPLGSNWQVKEVKDFNGQGFASIVVEDSQSNQVVLLNPQVGAPSDPGALPSGYTIVPSQPMVQRTAPTAYDTNFDGKGDLVWQNDQGQVSIWLMNGTSLTRAAAVGGANGADVKVKAVGDFDGDHKADLVWENTATGQAVLWTMDGTSAKTFAALGPANGADWSVVGAGDLNGDGNTDLVWEDTKTGQAVVWLMLGTQIQSAALVGGANGANWTIKGVGDLDGDGKADIVWQNNNGQAVGWLMNGTTVTTGANIGGANGATWQVAGLGDLDGDGKSDLVWQNDQGQAVFWKMNGTTVTSGQNVGSAQGAGHKVGEIADLNGDGRSDLVWQDQSGQATAWLMNGAAITAAANVGPANGAQWHLLATA